MKHAWYRILGGMVLAVLCAAVLPAQQAVQQDALKLYREKKYSDAITICEKEIAANPNNMDSYSAANFQLSHRRKILVLHRKNFYILSLDIGF